MRAPVTAYVALGANIGDAVAGVLRAMDAIDAIDGVRLVRRSSLYRSAPVDADGPDYINAVVELSSGLCAPELLMRLQAVENAAGRERPYLHAPRTLDLDLLRYGSARIESAALVVPHPRMLARAFVLLPLAEIAPQLVDASALQAVADQRCTRL